MLFAALIGWLVDTVGAEGWFAGVVVIILLGVAWELASLLAHPSQWYAPLPPEEDIDHSRDFWYT